MNVVTESLATATAASADEVGRLVTAHYERRGRELWGLARRLGASDEQAADVVQESHLRLWRELSAGQQIADVDGWLFRVAYRLVMDEHRGLRRIRELAGRLTQPGPAATAPTTDIDDAVSLWPLVDRLPARERATLYLRYRADLSFEQIGEVMGITPASARTYASRGTDRLRQLLPDEGERR